MFAPALRDIQTVMVVVAFNFSAVCTSDLASVSRALLIVAGLMLFPDVLVMSASAALCNRQPWPRRSSQATAVLFPALPMPVVCPAYVMPDFSPPLLMAATPNLFSLEVTTMDYVCLSAARTTVTALPLLLAVHVLVNLEVT